jgi:hypothetical protein
LRQTLISIIIFGVTSTALTQGMYGIVGFRSHTLRENIETNLLEANIDSFWGPDKVTYIQQDGFGSTSLGLGYLHMRKKPKTVMGGSQFFNWYFYWDSKSFDWKGYDDVQGYNSILRFDEEGTVNISDWNFGMSYGLRYMDGLNISASIEYSLGSTDSWDFDLPYNSQLSLSVSVGASKKTKLGHLGASVHHYPSRYFMGTSGPVGSSSEFRAEIPIVIYGGALFLGLMFFDPELASELISDITSSGGGSSKSKYCHVFGKIRYVDYGEDYKVKIVDYGADIDVVHEQYFADSPGEWRTVDFGEDYKIRVVDFGEDFTIKYVSFGEGCNP